MKKKVLALLAVWLCATSVAADEYALAVGWDLDGEAADADQIVASVALTDAASFTIAANPDVCRLVDIGVTDADSSIVGGTLTVTGTDCWGDALVAVYMFGGGGSATYSLTVTSGSSSGAYFKTVTEVSTNTLTGEGAGDVVVVGYSSNSGYLFPMYGVRRSGPMGTRWLSVDDSIPMDLRITTSGVSNTTVNAVASNGAFTNVAVKDLILVRVGGASFARKVTARASANSITIDQPITIETAGVTFRYQKFYEFAAPEDAWIAMSGFEGAGFVIQVAANADTGGVISTVECKVQTTTHNPQIQVDTVTVATGTAGADASGIDLTLTPYTHCRIGAKFGTGDDTDTVPENIYVALAASR